MEDNYYILGFSCQVRDVTVTSQTRCEVMSIENWIGNPRSNLYDRYSTRFFRRRRRKSCATASARASSRSSPQHYKSPTSIPKPKTVPARAGHPGGNQGANFKSISRRCYLREVAFECKLAKETMYLPLGCLQGGSLCPSRTRTAIIFPF